MAKFKDSDDGYYSVIDVTATNIPDNWIEITEAEYLLVNPIIQTVAPISCSAWQVRKALNARNLRSQIEAAVAASSIEIQDGWNHATNFLSDDAFVIQFAALIGQAPHEFITYAATL